MLFYGTLGTNSLLFFLVRELQLLDDITSIWACFLIAALIWISIAIIYDYVLHRVIPDKKELKSILV